MAFQNIFLTQFQELEQTSTVEEFHKKFDTLRTLVEYTELGIPEEYFTSLFVHGLETEVQAYVDGFLPGTVIDAYCLALIFVNGYSHTFILNPINVTPRSGCEHLTDNQVQIPNVGDGDVPCEAVHEHMKAVSVVVDSFSLDPSTIVPAIAAFTGVNLSTQNDTSGVLYQGKNICPMELAACEALHPGYESCLHPEVSGSIVNETGCVLDVTCYISSCQNPLATGSNSAMGSQIDVEEEVISVQIVDLVNVNGVLAEDFCPSVTVLFSVGTATQDKGGTTTPRHDVKVARPTEFPRAPVCSFCHSNTGYIAPKKGIGLVDANAIPRVCTNEKEDDAVITCISTSSTSPIVASTTATPTSSIRKAVELDDSLSVVHYSGLRSSGRPPPTLALSCLLSYCTYTAFHYMAGLCITMAGVLIGMAGASSENHSLIFGVRSLNSEVYVTTSELVNVVHDPCLLYSNMIQENTSPSEDINVFGCFYCGKWVTFQWVVAYFYWASSGWPPSDRRVYMYHAEYELTSGCSGTLPYNFCASSMFRVFYALTSLISSSLLSLECLILLSNGIHLPTLAIWGKMAQDTTHTLSVELVTSVELITEHASGLNYANVVPVTQCADATVLSLLLTNQLVRPSFLSQLTTYATYVLQAPYNMISRDLILLVHTFIQKILYYVPLTEQELGQGISGVLHERRTGIPTIIILSYWQYCDPSLLVFMGFPGALHSGLAHLNHSQCHIPLSCWCDTSTPCSAFLLVFTAAGKPVRGAVIFIFYATTINQLRSIYLVIMCVARGYNKRHQSLLGSLTYCDSGVPQWHLAVKPKLNSVTPLLLIFLTYFCHPMIFLCNWALTSKKEDIVGIESHFSVDDLEVSSNAALRQYLVYCFCYVLDVGMYLRCFDTGFHSTIISARTSLWLFYEPNVLRETTNWWGVMSAYMTESLICLYFSDHDIILIPMVLQRCASAVRIWWLVTQNSFSIMHVIQSLVCQFLCSSSYKLALLIVLLISTTVPTTELSTPKMTVSTSTLQSECDDNYSTTLQSYGCSLSILARA